nr:alpha/beta fold hydrolase [uncultured Oscillibacter sp.]
MGNASASLYSFHIPGAQGKLACMLYSAGSDREYPTIIFTHGFPGHEKNAALAQLLRKAGFHVLIFYYAGCWGSEGVFSFAGSIRDTVDVIDFLMADETYHIDRRHLFLLGHSFGAPVIARAMEQRPFIYGAVFLMPYDLGRLYKMSRSDPELEASLLNLLQEGAEFIPNTSCQQFYQEIQENPDYYSYFPLMGMLAQKPIYWVSCKNDDQASEKIHTLPFMERLKQDPNNRILWHSYDTDHYFSNMQERLAGEITCFIEAAIAKDEAVWLDDAAFQERLTSILTQEFRTITSGQAAQRFHISKPYFCAMVKKVTGTTFSQLLLRHRMELAGQMLTSGTSPVAAIADYLGYSDASYFEKVFKKYYGCPPAEFRRAGTHST